MNNTSKYLHQLEEIQTLLSYVVEEAKVFHKQIEENGNIIRFKKVQEHDLEEEFWRCDSRLRFIFLSYALAVYIKFEYKATITAVERTQAEQDNIYLHYYDTKVVEDYKRSPWISVHQTNPCRAIDFRSEDMSDDVVNFTLDYFRKQVVYSGNKDSVLHHSVGLGHHFHAQCDWDGTTEIKQILGG